MSIRKKVMEQLVFEPYQRSTQYLDLMLQKPNGTEQLGSQQCNKKVKLIAVGDLQLKTIELIEKKIKDLIKTSGKNHKCHNYRGYPIAIEFDGPMQTDFFLILANEPEKHIELVRVIKPVIGI